MSDPHDYEAHKQRSVDGSKLAHQRLHELAQAYHAMFNSDVGRKVMADLVDCYGGSSMGHSPRKTEIHASQRDVLLRIEDLIAIAGLNPDDLSLNVDVVENLLNPWRRYEN